MSMLPSFFLGDDGRQKHHALSTKVMQMRFDKSWIPFTRSAAYSWPSLPPEAKALTPAAQYIKLTEMYQRAKVHSQQLQHTAGPHFLPVERD